MDKGKQESAYYTMDEINELIKDMQVSSYGINSDHWVDITHIDNPHHFYTRLTKYRAIVEKIETLKSGLKPSTININDIILFTLKRDSNISNCARGQIKYIQNDGENVKCDIFALDYGYFMKDVLLEYIWDCDALMLNMPPLAIKCQLANCAPKGGDWGDAIEAFKCYIGDERAKMIVSEETSNNLIVTLYNTCPDDIATLLALTGFTTLGYVHNSINKIHSTSIPKNISYYNFIKFQTNATLHVRVLSGQTLKAFYVADIYKYKEFLKESANITYYCKKEAKVDVDLRSGDIVSVRNNLNQYDRGLIKELHCDKALTLLVDLGKEEVVDIMNLKKMPKQCLTMPVIAIFCSAEENQVWDNGLHRLLYPGFEFIITIKEPGHQFQSPNIVKISPISTTSQQSTSKPREKRL